MFCGTRGAFDERDGLLLEQGPRTISGLPVCQEVTRDRLRSTPTVVGLFSRGAKEGSGWRHQDRRLRRRLPSAFPHLLFQPEKSRACLFPHRHFKHTLTMKESCALDSTKPKDNKIQNPVALAGFKRGHPGLWMPHVSTVSPRLFGLVLGGILHVPRSIWSRCADGSAPGPTLVRNRSRCNEKPWLHRRSRVGQRSAETTMTSSVPWGRPLCFEAKPRDTVTKSSKPTLATLVLRIWDTGLVQHGSYDEP